MSAVSYKSEFFSMHQEKSLSSAREVIPVVLGYIQPLSVLDIGCGNGTWLKAWQEQNITDILGVDGTYVNTSELLIDKKNFEASNLEEGYQANKKYDLVTSLEVAEHIRPEFANGFIKSLCELGDVILFSAAIPGQEGTYHFNEQYPDYWVQLFQQNGFVAIDCLREKIWVNEKISWWYRQNVFFFVRKEKLSKFEKLDSEYKKRGAEVMSLVHPELLKMKDSQLSFFKKNLHNPLRAILYFSKKIFGK